MSANTQECVRSRTSVCPSVLREICKYTPACAHAHARPVQGFMFKTHPCLVFLPPRVLASPRLLFPALFSLFRRDDRGLAREREDAMKEGERSERRRRRERGTNTSIWVKVGVASGTSSLFNSRFKLGSIVAQSRPGSLHSTGLCIFTFPNVFRRANGWASRLPPKVSAVVTGDSFQASREKPAAAATHSKPNLIWRVSGLLCPSRRRSFGLIAGARTSPQHPPASSGETRVLIKPAGVNKRVSSSQSIKCPFPDRGR